MFLHVVSMQVGKALKFPTSTPPMPGVMLLTFTFNCHLKVEGLCGLTGSSSLTNFFCTNGWSGSLAFWVGEHCSTHFLLQLAAIF
jgi:hypothetical protein